MDERELTHGESLSDTVDLVLCDRHIASEAAERTPFMNKMS